MNDFKDEKNLDNYSYKVNIKNTEKILAQMKSNVCKIYNGETKGTGFFCKISHENKDINLLITNNHVFNGNDISKKKEIKFSINNERQMGTIYLNNKIKKFTDKDLDITFIEIKDNFKINNDDKIKINFLEIEEKINQEELYYNELFVKKPIYTLHYLNGEEILVSYGLFRGIDKTNKHNIFHTCSTDDGSSGSPILLLDSLKVIGIHKAKSKNFYFNKGIFIKYAIDKFFKSFPKKFDTKKEKNKKINIGRNCPQFINYQQNNSSKNKNKTLYIENSQSKNNQILKTVYKNKNLNVQKNIKKNLLQIKSSGNLLSSKMLNNNNNINNKNIYNNNLNKEKNKINNNTITPKPSKNKNNLSLNNNLNKISINKSFIKKNNNKINNFYGKRNKSKENKIKLNFPLNNDDNSELLKTLSLIDKKIKKLNNKNKINK